MPHAAYPLPRSTFIQLLITSVEFNEEMYHAVISFYFQTILDDSNGNSQNSRACESNGSPSSSSTSAFNQQENPNAAPGILQNQTSGSQLSPYFPPSTNAPTGTQAILRTTVQMRQMVTAKLSGQTVAMATTQASQRTVECCVPVNRSALPSNDRSSPFVQDMMWVSQDLRANSRWLKVYLNH